MLQNLRLAEYDIAGNVLRAWYDDGNKLAFVVDETIDEYKPNVLLVVRSDGTRRWDDLLQNVYNVDLEVVRPRRDNKYQKLDIEYGGIDVYEDLISAYEAHGDLGAALADLVDFRDAAVRRAATVRLTNAQDEVAQAKITMGKAEHTIKSLNDRMRVLRDRLARQKSFVGREPTKQSASRILRVEAQIESTEDKLLRAERRLDNARRRVEIATEEANSAMALLALRRPSVDVDVAEKHRVIDAKVKKDDVAKMPVTDENVEIDDQKLEDLDMSNDSEEVKPLLDKDPEILDDDIAFKPVDFGDIKPAARSKKVRQSEPERPLSPYAAIKEEPKPEVVHDDGDRNDAAFGFPGEDESSDDTEYGVDDALPHTDIDSDADDYTEKESKELKPARDESSFEIKPLDDAHVEDDADTQKGDEEAKSEFEDNFGRRDFGDYGHDEPEYTEKNFDEQKGESVINTIKSVDESVPADIDTTGQVSSAQYDNRGVEAPKRPFSPVAVPKTPVEETRPMSPIQHDENPRPVGEKRSGFAYYVLLILLIALSIFTLWLYQKKNGGSVPIFDPEPTPPVVEPTPVNPPIEIEPPFVEPDVPVVEPTPVDKPIEVRYPNDDILRGGEPDVPVVEPEEDVLARKVPYGVSRDDKPVFVEVAEPVVQVTTVTAPDVIIEDEIVSVPMPYVGEDVETVVEYNNPANVEYVTDDYVIPEPQYVPQPQYIEPDYDNYVAEPEPVDETQRDFSVHDGGQYSVTKTVTFIAD